MYRRSIILVILLLLFAAEAFFARQFYIEIVPFPEDEWWMTVVNNCLRDLLLAGVAAYCISGEIVLLTVRNVISR